LGKSERWDLNQQDGRLIFTFADKIVTCEAQIIGSFDKSKGTWLWAWDNPSVLSNLTTASRELREYGRQHGYAKLTQAEWKRQRVEPDGAANRSQPIHSETNRTAAAAGSGR
jgi:hypothetical protein